MESYAWTFNKRPNIESPWRAWKCATTSIHYLHQGTRNIQLLETSHLLNAYPSILYYMYIYYTQTYIHIDLDIHTHTIHLYYYWSHQHRLTLCRRVIVLTRDSFKKFGKSSLQNPQNYWNGFLKPLAIDKSFKFVNAVTFQRIIYDVFTQARVDRDNQSPKLTPIIVSAIVRGF